jgi:RNA polymerase sigma factor (sigma-70 family)
MPALDSTRHWTPASGAGSLPAVESWFQPDLPDWPAVWSRCYRRIRTWRVPPRWSRRDWLEEALAQGTAAAWQALRDYDPAREVPRSAFVYQRVLSSVLTRYRHEWAHARRYSHDTPADEEKDRRRYSLCQARVQEALHDSLAELAPPDRCLIEHLFWDGYTQAEVATLWGISQQAVSKRAQTIILALSESTRGLHKNEDEPGCKRGPSAQYLY